MKVINDLYWSPDFGEGSVVTVGEFDGFHRGQGDIIRETIRAGAEAGRPTIAVTFSTNLPRVQTDGRAGRSLTTLAQKLTLFEAAGVDYVVVLPVDEIISRGRIRPSGESPSGDDNTALIDWVMNDVVIGALHAHVLVVGEIVDTAVWGRTNMDQLRERAATAGFDVIVVPSPRASKDGAFVTAGAIRDALDACDVESANDMLGRPFEIRSTVSRGEQRGRHIGFPTANLPVDPDIQIPGDGVYACWYFRDDGTKFKSAVNVGKRPTFYPDNDQSLIEAHLIGYRGDLYSESARLEFVECIRPERKFDSVAELRDQLRNDIAEAVSRLDGDAGGED